MSIGSIQSNPWANPWSVASHSGTNTSWNTAAAGASQDVSGTTVAPANPFEQLASNIQAMLIQAQSTAAGTGTAPGQNLATSLQTLMNDLQPSTTANPQTASTNPTDPVGQTEHHHHHHHHEADGDASGATAVAGSSTSSGAAANSVTGADQAVSQVFAADIAQAIQSYGGAAASSMMPALTI